MREGLEGERIEEVVRVAVREALVAFGHPTGHPAITTSLIPQKHLRRSDHLHKHQISNHFPKVTQLLSNGARVYVLKPLPILCVSLKSGLGGELDPKYQRAMSRPQLAFLFLILVLEAERVGQV